MPPVVIDLRNAEDWRDVIHQSVQALVEGRLVSQPIAPQANPKPALPTQLSEEPESLP